MTKKCTVCGETQTIENPKICTVCGSAIPPSENGSKPDDSTPISVYVPKVKSLNVPYTIDAKSVLKELNSLRSDPAGFAQYLLDEIMPGYNGKTYISKEGGERLTSEGPEAVKEAAEWLMAHSEPVKTLTSSFGLGKIARELCTEQNGCDSIGGFLANGNGLDKRVEKYGSWTGKLSECLFYHAVSPKDVIVQLVIDDGLKERPNRARLMDPDFAAVGIWGSTHKIYGNVVSIVLAQKYERDGSSESVIPLKVEVDPQDPSKLRAALPGTSNLLTNENGKLFRSENYILLRNASLLSFFKWRIPEELKPCLVEARRGDDGNAVVEFSYDKVNPFTLEKSFSLAASKDPSAGEEPRIASVDFVDRNKKDSLKVLIAPAKKAVDVSVKVAPDSEKVGFSVSFEFTFEDEKVDNGKKRVVETKTRQSVHVVRKVDDVTGTVDEEDGLTVVVKLIAAAGAAAPKKGGDDGEEVEIPLK